MLGFLCVDGNEVAHPGRLMAYLRNVGGPCVIGPNLNDGCSVGVIDPDDDEFLTPWEDNAPWFDPADDRSRDVLGVWIRTFALGSPINRETTGLRFGGVHGPLQFGPREILIEGTLLTRSLAGTHYGRQWITEALLGSPCNGDCDASILTFMRHCGTEDDDGTRFLNRVALNSLEWIDQAPEIPMTCGSEFTAVLTAAVPWVTRAAEHVFSALLMAPEPECDLCGQILGAIQTTPELPSLACGCVSSVPRRIPQRRRPNCYAPPLSVARQITTITNPKQWTEGTLQISVYGGTSNFSGAGVRNLRIRGYANPEAFAAVDPIDVIASGDACLDVEVGCVPTGATLTIDGAIRRSRVGVGENVRDGMAYLSSKSGRFMWPDYGCNGLVLVIEADAVLTSPDATIEISSVEIERG